VFFLIARITTLNILHFPLGAQLLVFVFVFFFFKQTTAYEISGCLVGSER